jgi:hypothetical protein
MSALGEDAKPMLSGRHVAAIRAIVDAYESAVAQERARWGTKIAATVHGTISRAAAKRASRIESIGVTLARVEKLCGKIPCTMLAILVGSGCVETTTDWSGRKLVLFVKPTRIAHERLAATG